MKRNQGILVGMLALLGVAAGAYWLGTRAPASSPAPQAAKAERKVLYYRNPMGLPDTSPVPKKDAMGMDYVPVYEGEPKVGEANQIVIDSNRVQQLGVQSEAAARRELGSSLRLHARIETDEQRLYVLSPKFAGWIEKLYVNSSGQSVRKGEPLFEVYSQELVSTLRELELARQGLAALKDGDAAAQSMQRLVEAGEARLRNWGITAAPQDDGRITYHAPANGIVLEKNAVQGMRFMPGETLFRIADLSMLWAIAEVPEQDIAAIRPGNRAEIRVDALPGRTFAGKVEFIYPTLNAMTRTVPVRIVLRNPDGALKPGMYAEARIAIGNASKVLTVPTSAVIDSGTRQTVLVRLDAGRFAPRTVTLGRRSDDYVEVLAGLSEGEQVVTRANFLLDSESNLKAAFGGMADMPAPEKTVGYGVTGVLEAIHDDGSVSITHEPIPALKWPAMTMDFALAHPSLAANIKPGSAIEFEIVERGQGEWIITKLVAKEAGHAEHRH